jgi:hypothetical protein
MADTKKNDQSRLGFISKSIEFELRVLEFVLNAIADLRKTLCVDIR